MKLIWASLIGASCALQLLPITILTPSKFVPLQTSSNSTLYSISLAGQTPYSVNPPLFLELRGSRYQIGYDYAALLHDQAAYTLESFVSSVYPAQVMFPSFLKGFVTFDEKLYSIPADVFRRIRSCCSSLLTTSGQASLSRTPPPNSWQS